MNYSDFTREQLIRRIEELEVLNHAFMMEKHKEAAQRNDLPYCLGRWYWNTKTNAITFNAYNAVLVGYDISEIPHNITFPLPQKMIRRTIRRQWMPWSPT